MLKLLKLQHLEFKTFLPHTHNPVLFKQVQQRQQLQKFYHLAPRKKKKVTILSNREGGQTDSRDPYRQKHK